LPTSLRLFDVNVSCASGIIHHLRSMRCEVMVGNGVQRFATTETPGRLLPTLQFSTVLHAIAATSLCQGAGLCTTSLVSNFDS
jgi:hypothetical protein